MFEIGRLVVKIAGRDAGKYGIVIDILGNNFVMIEGQVRRRKCNIIHLEPLKDILKIKKGASFDEVSKVLKTLDIEAVKTKPKQKTERPRQIRKQKVKEEAETSSKSKKEKVQASKEKTSDKKVESESKTLEKKTEKEEITKTNVSEKKE